MFDRNLLRIPGMAKVLAALTAVSLLVAALTFGQALTLALAIAALWDGSPLADQMGTIAAFLGCFAGRHLTIFLQDTALDRYSIAQADRLRSLLLERALTDRALLTDREGSASLVTMATQGISEVETYLRLMPPKICGLAACALPLLIAECAIDWVSGIILAATVPVIFYFMMLLGRQARDRAAAQYRTYTRLSNHFIDTLRGLPALRAFGAEKREDGRIFQVSERLRTRTMKTISVATLSSALLDLTATLGVAAVAMMLAFRLMDGSVTLPIGLCALMVAPEFYTPLRSFAADFHASLDAKNALARIFALLEGERSAPVIPEPLPPWDAESVLSLEGVRFGYGDGPRALRDISLTARGFERIAIVGPSGAGKSTLANLLAGFSDPEGGSITVEGKDTASLGISGWLDQLHYIPQHPSLFQGTLRDNIAFYSPDASEEAVRRAVHSAGLDEVVASLPQGLDTPLGAGGRTLSGGQAQRVALARVFLDARPILIFDEPTAHLDIETELELKEAMVPLMEGKLVFFATHRLHWLDAMGRVIVLENGTILQDRPITEGDFHEGA